MSLGKPVVKDCFMDDEMKAHVKEKTKEVIQELSTYTVYHTPTRYDDHKSLAYQFMEEAVIENRQVIFDCVLKKIEAYPYESKIEDDGITWALLEAIKKGLTTSK